MAEVQSLIRYYKIPSCNQTIGFTNTSNCLVRYQIMVLELLANSTQEGKTSNWLPSTQTFTEIHPPNALDLSQDTDYASQAAQWGIEVGV